MPIDQSPVALFDFRVALGRLAGDTELFREMVQFYLADTPGLLEQVHANLARQNAPEVERAAHTLKSMSSTFDGQQAVGAAAAIEQLAREGNLDGIHSQHVERLSAEVRRLSAALAAFELPAG